MKRVFQQKASENDKIECHVTQYENGGFFHLCLKYKRLPNNHKTTTWMCFGCLTKKSSNKTETVDKDIEVDHATDYDLLPSAGASGDVTFLGVTKQSISVNKKAKLGDLTKEHFDIIESSTSGLDCDIIQLAQVLLQNIDTNIYGFQRPVLGPVRNVKIITGEFIQILHIGKEHGHVPVTLDVYQGKLMYITACIIVLRQKSKNRF